LGEPDDEDGFDGDVRGSLTAYVFKYVETMVLNDIVESHENHGKVETHDDFNNHAYFSAL
jgi:hypothetical protein